MGRNNKNFQPKLKMPKPRNAFAVAAWNRKAGPMEETDKAETVREGCTDCGSPRVFKHGLCAPCLNEATLIDEDNGDEA